MINYQWNSLKKRVREIFSKKFPSFFLSKHSAMPLGNARSHHPIRKMQRKKGGGERERKKDGRFPPFDQPSMTSADLTQGQSPLVLVSFFPNKSREMFRNSSVQRRLLVHSLVSAEFHQKLAISTLLLPAPQSSTQKVVFIRHYMYLV